MQDLRKLSGYGDPTGFSPGSYEFCPYG